MLRKVSTVLRRIVTALLLLYVVLLVLLHIPLVQRQIGRVAADALSQQLGTEVRVGRVNLGLLNRVIIDDISVKDRQHQPMLRVPRTAVTINLFALVTGRISISTAQLFGLQARLNRPSKDKEANYEFVLRAFASKDNGKEKTPIDLRVGSFIMRRADVRYDVFDQPRRMGRLDLNHLHAQNLAITASLRTLTPDTLNVAVKRFEITEANSQLRLEGMRFELQGSPHKGVLSDFFLRMPHSTVQINALTLEQSDTTALDTVRHYRIHTPRLNAKVYLPDFRALSPHLGRYHGTVKVSGEAKVTDTEASVRRLQVSTVSDDLELRADARLVRSGAKEELDFDIQVHSLHADMTAVHEALSPLLQGNTLGVMMERVGRLDVKAEAHRHGGDLRAKADITASSTKMTVEGALRSSGQFEASVAATDMDLKALTGDEKLGTATFDLTTAGRLGSGHRLEDVNVEATVAQFDYAGYSYHDIVLDAGYTDHTALEANVHISDPNLSLNLQAAVDGEVSAPDAVFLNFSLSDFNPHALHLTADHAGEQFAARFASQVQGHDVNTLTGWGTLDSLTIRTPDRLITLSPVSLTAEGAQGADRHIALTSDFLNASIDGHLAPEHIVRDLERVLDKHLPSIAHTQRKNYAKGIRSHSDTPSSGNQFDFDIDVKESPILHYITDHDFTLHRPLHIDGRVDGLSASSRLHVDAPRLSYEGIQYDDVRLRAEESATTLSVQASLLRLVDDHSMRLDVEADAAGDRLRTRLQWNKPDDKPTTGDVSVLTTFADSLSQMKVHAQILPSTITFNDTLWHLEPATIDAYGKHVSCHNLRVSNGNRYVRVDGAISALPTDSIVAELNDVELSYLQALTNFTAVTFAGRATGRAVVSGVFGRPLFHADLSVDDFALKGGKLGHGDIHAHWDEPINGVSIAAHIVDEAETDEPRVTDVSGYVAPADKDIQLRIDTRRTSAEFLNGILSSTFRDIKGDVDGTIRIIGPLNDINLVGDVRTNASLTLRSTGVTYHINPSDTLRLRRHYFQFDDVDMTDDYGNHATLQGTVTHFNMKNFAYHFHVDMTHLLAYEEHEFNADKFMGTVFGNGWLEVDGSDGHPLRITADITPTKGSVFAYDSATPDAITQTSFLTFRDASATHPDSIATAVEEEPEYESDIFMDVGIHLNPDCEIKLRMDNADDGYISTFGTGTLQAHYHNKGAFTLQGTYNILRGSYRLYLQNIIYRDLSIQEGSDVVFNGNPFDANIHLICWHTLQAVPLSDLTTQSTPNQTNKVKVICILDITGQLGNMNFKFDLNLPNVSDETRQLVRSLISTDEEMNMQLIYLLGLGRFYANEYARATGESTSSGAMNSLLSSTISGQINQMLSNVIGTDSNWNFGTGLTTGEQGWNDLDVEGILSGRLLDDRLLINGNFGYRDNAMTRSASFIGDFDIKWRLRENGNTYLKAYNQTNDRYFTKATLNTQGIGISYQRDFETWRDFLARLRRRKRDGQTLK